MQVGEAFQKAKTDKELKLIASDPDETHAFKVTNYAALDGLLSKLQQNIIPMEGEGSWALATLWQPLGIRQRARALGSSPTLSYVHVALWATPVTSLSLSCSISKKATISQPSSLP